MTSRCDEAPDGLDELARTSGSVAAVGGAGRDHGENRTRHSVLTSISTTRRMFPMTGVALMHHGLEQAADRFGDRDAVRAGDERWSFARARRAQPTPSPGTSPARGVGPGDRVAVMMTNRVEFVVAVHAISKLGAAAVLLSPAWKAVEVGHAVGAHRRPSTPSPTAPPSRCSPSASGADARHRPRRRGRRSARRSAATARPAGRRRRGTATPTRRSSSSARARPACPRRCATPTASIGPRHRATGCTALGLGPDDRFQVATPPSHILGLLNLLAAAEAGATVRLHRRFDLDEVLRRIESDRITLEMAVAPIALAMANHPRPRGLRPLVAPLHHVGRHAGHRERGRGRHRAHRRPVAAGLRRQRAAGDRRATRSTDPTRGGSTRPACRRPRSSCGSSTSTPARCSRPARSARSRRAARRSWRATCPRRPTPTRSPTAGTAPATSAGSSPRAGCTSPTAPRR